MRTQEIRGFTFFFDGDYGGNVIINNTSAGQGITIPFEALKDFVAEWKRSELISRLESMGTDDLLMFSVSSKNGRK